MSMFGTQSIPNFQMPGNYACFGDATTDGFSMRVTGVELSPPSTAVLDANNLKRGYEQATPLVIEELSTPFMAQQGFTKRARTESVEAYEAVAPSAAPSAAPAAAQQAPDYTIFDDEGLICLPAENNFDLVTPCVPMSAQSLASLPSSFTLESGVPFTLEASAPLVFDAQNGPDFALKTDVQAHTMSLELPQMQPRPVQQPQPAVVDIVKAPGSPGRVRRPSDTVVEITVALQQLNDIATVDPDAALQAGWHGAVESIRNQVADLSNRMTQLSNLPAINLSDSLDAPASPSLSPASRISTSVSVSPPMAPMGRACVPQSPAISISKAVNPHVPPPAAIAGCDGPALRLDGALEHVWYADRPYPAFRVSLVDPTTQRCPPALRSADVVVSLLDGDGVECNDKLTGPAASNDFRFPLSSSGVAEIDGMRFGCVSSKCGGHFQIVVSLADDDSQDGTSSAAAATPFVSGKIQVLSYRLFHSPKVDFEKLTPQDSVSKMKGIGNLYAKRFARQGICTVQQMAALDPSGDEVKALLENLRRDRGALTLSKFNDYIAQARGICRRYNDACESMNDEITALLA